MLITVGDMLKSWGTYQILIPELNKKMSKNCSASPSARFGIGALADAESCCFCAAALMASWPARPRFALERPMVLRSARRQQA